MSAEKRLPNDCFALPPGVYWTPVDDALALLRARMRPVAATQLAPLASTAGRFVAADAIARRPHPAADNAAVDGYAFAHPGGAPEALTLRLRDGRAAAGAPWSGMLGAGEAVRIFTGAPMPEGADTVVLQEDVVIDGADVRFPPPRRPGANRRRAGENLSPGATALRAGARVTPQALAQAACAGLSELEVRAPLRVAVLSTGDELIAPEAAATAGPAQVVDANGPMLESLASGLGFEVTARLGARDVREEVARALDEAAEAADAIVASGGASGGDEDHMSRLLSDNADAAFHLWRIAVKPGRPLAMGLWRGKPVFGLPGNPVAAFVCFLIFVRPALVRLAGGDWPELPALTAPAAFDYPKKPGRREFVRVRLGADGRLEKYRSEGSGLVEGLLWSDGLADLPDAAGPFEAGVPLRYLPYSALGVRL